MRGILASLPERLALDLSVANLEHGRIGAALVITRSAMAAKEVLSRVATPLVIVAHTKALAQEIGVIVTSAMRPDRYEIAISTLGAFEPLSHGPIGSVLWLEPTRETLDESVALVKTATAETARIAVIGTGPLDRWRFDTWHGLLGRPDRVVDPFKVGAHLDCGTEQEWRSASGSEARPTLLSHFSRDRFVDGTSPIARKLRTASH